MSTAADPTAGAAANPVALPPPGEELTADERLGRSFKATLAAVRRLRGRESNRLGQLSYAQYSVLFSLAHEPEQTAVQPTALPASRLAALADVSPATVTQMIDHLEADGLVTRTRSERDKRVVLVALTRAGRALVEERRARFEPRFRTALEGFSDADLLTAAAVLDRLRAMFDAFDGED